jgi:hypothetical protein
MASHAHMDLIPPLSDDRIPATSVLPRSGRCAATRVEYCRGAHGAAERHRPQRTLRRHSRGIDSLHRHATVLMRFGGYTILTVPTLFTPGITSISATGSSRDRRAPDAGSAGPFALRRRSFRSRRGGLTGSFRADRPTPKRSVGFNATALNPPSVGVATARQERRISAPYPGHAGQTWSGAGRAASATRYGKPARVRYGSPFRLYISGDTMIHDEFRTIPAQSGSIHVALLHLGGTRDVLGISVTMDAKQGVEALKILDARTTTTTVFKSPLDDFKTARPTRGTRGESPLPIPWGDVRVPLRARATPHGADSRQGRSRPEPQRGR